MSHEISQEEFFKSARHNMVHNQIVPNEVSDPHIISALLSVPKHEFLDEKWAQVAYLDRSIKLFDTSREIMRTDLFAKALQLSGISSKSDVLDLCCGTGYSTAVISHIARSVIGIEPIRDLAMRSTRLVIRFGAQEKISIKNCDPFDIPEDQQFDICISNIKIEQFSINNFASALNEGGKLVSVVIMAENRVPALCLYQKINGKLSLLDYDNLIY